MFSYAKQCRTVRLACTYSLFNLTQTAYDPSGLVSPAFSGLSDYAHDPSVTTVRIRPDNRGRFGFNVKGGANHKTPVIVSRVGENLPADVCIPKLCEGDQILVINGQDVASLTHEQVIQLIRSSKEKNTELEMLVRPRIYNTEDAIEETGGPSVPDSGDAPPLPPRPPQTLVSPTTNGGSMILSITGEKPTTNGGPGSFARGPLTSSHRRSSALISWNLIPDKSSPLWASMRELEAAILSGQTERDFSDMYKKKAGYSAAVSKKLENCAKNRYRDILPYDQTRVILLDAPSDYINANHVNGGTFNASEMPSYNTILVASPSSHFSDEMKASQHLPNNGSHQVYVPLQQKTLYLDESVNQCDLNYGLLRGRERLSMYHNMKMQEEANWSATRPRRHSRNNAIRLGTSSLRQFSPIDALNLEGGAKTPEKTLILATQQSKSKNAISGSCDAILEANDDSQSDEPCLPFTPKKYAYDAFREASYV
ncbi:Tyrosine-protein phosphatase non-receptor type 3 [Cichlidogyrus casuarinus]|uniref:Tyrosine-protein phosphatase non-receptor type 3 n=1 Tax=Cichlidogyrus casuarinus TaxID=1844966 RepID=A0ABD2PYR5_9PLAT